MLRRLASLLVVTALLATAGCRRSTGEAKPRYITEDAPLEMTVKIRGDVQLDFDAKVPSKYTSIRSGGSGGTNVLAVRPLDALRHEQSAFVPGMSVTPYEGDGTYVVARAAEPTEGAGSQPSEVKSSVSLVWYADGNLEGEPVQFDRHLENCVVKIDKDGTTGHAKCPKIAAKVGDKTISLDFKWKAPKFKEHDRITVPPDPDASTTTVPPDPDASTTTVPPDPATSSTVPPDPSTSTSVP